MKKVDTAADSQSRLQRIREWAALPGGFGIITGVSMFLTITIIGVVYPFISPYAPDEFVGDSFEPPSLDHQIGRAHV